MTIADQIQQQITTHKVLLYMKGTPESPQCGFSHKVVSILQQCGVPFQSVDVLNPDIRETLKQCSGWPTFPQLYLNGALIGGSDIITSLYQNGELQAQLSEVLA